VPPTRPSDDPGGLELSRRFFQDVVLPALQRTLPDLVPAVAVGVPGGSQCHGHDDLVSRDHGWGPAFAVWLRSPLVPADAERVDRFLLSLPKEYCGHRVLLPEHAVTLDEYVRSVVGIAVAPTDPVDWLRIPEEWLFEVTHRPLLLDVSGFAGLRFASFLNYPEDVWRKRLAAQLFWLSEWGMKHLKRAQTRGDSRATMMYWVRFSEVVAKVLFLLHRRFAPYHKWLFRIASELSPMSESIMSTLDQGLLSAPALWSHEMRGIAE